MSLDDATPAPERLDWIYCDRKEDFFVKLDQKFYVMLDKKWRRARRYCRYGHPFLRLPELCWRLLLDLILTTYPWIDKVEWIIDDQKPLETRILIPDDLRTKTDQEITNYHGLYTLQGSDFRFVGDRDINHECFQPHIYPNIGDRIAQIAIPLFNKSGCRVPYRFSMPVTSSHGATSLPHGWCASISGTWIIVHESTSAGRMNFSIEKPQSWM